jgi:hypothetical protein
MDPSDAATAVGTIFGHLLPGFYIQHLRQFRAFFEKKVKLMPERAVFVTFDLRQALVQFLKVAQVRLKPALSSAAREEGPLP